MFRHRSIQPWLISVLTVAAVFMGTTTWAVSNPNPPQRNLNNGIENELSFSPDIEEYSFKYSRSLQPNGSFLLLADASVQTSVMGLTEEFKSVSIEGYMGYNAVPVPTPNTAMSSGSGSGSTIVVISGQIIPEPTTILLMATGLLGLAGYRWSQRRREGTHVG